MSQHPEFRAFEDSGRHDFCVLEDELEARRGVSQGVTQA